MRFFLDLQDVCGRFVFPRVKMFFRCNLKFVAAAISSLFSFEGFVLLENDPADVCHYTCIPSCDELFLPAFKGIFHMLQRLVGYLFQLNDSTAGWRFRALLQTDERRRKIC